MDIKDFIRILKENKNKENMTEDRRKEIIKKSIDTYGYDDKDATKLSNTISFISLIHRIDLNLEHNIGITKNIRQTNIRFEKGIINKLIIVEELMELAQVIINDLKGTPEDKYHLLEEYADVMISLMCIDQLYDIDKQSVQNAIDVKLRRENDRLCTKQI